MRLPWSLAVGGVEGEGGKGGERIGMRGGKEGHRGEGKGQQQAARKTHTHANGESTEEVGGRAQQQNTVTRTS